MIPMMIQICTIKASLMYNIDTSLINTVIKTESNYNTMAISKTHDHGLMQLNKKPVYDVCENIRLGTAYLNKCKKTYEKRLGKAWVVCYNTGIHGASKLTKRMALKHPYFKRIRTNYVSDKVHKAFPYRLLDERFNDGWEG